MFKYFKTIKQLTTERDNLRRANEELTKSFLDVNNKLKEERENPKAEKVIAKILNRGIKWYDWTELPKGEQVAYVKDAQYLLELPVFKNETQAYITDLIQEIAKRSKNWEEVRDLRHSINGVETLIERLENIYVPEETVEEVKEPYATV